MRVLSAVLANIALLVNAFLASTLCFTLLPVSVTILTLPINAVVFVIWRSRLGIGLYVVAIHGIAILLSIFIIILIATLGRAPFERLLDWV